MKRYSKLQPGDMIKCHNKNDMIDTSVGLAQVNVQTDFRYEHDGVKGFWLIVTEVEDEYEVLD